MPELEDAHAGAVEGAVVEAEAAQGVAQVVVRLAGRDDAEPRVAGALDAVDAVLARVGQREVGADAEQRALHLERGGGEEVAVRLVLVAAGPAAPA